MLPGGGWQFSSGTTFGNPTGPRAWVNGVYGGLPKTVATDMMSIAGRAGALPVTTTATMGLGDAAAAVGRCLAGGGVVCGAATAAAAAYAAYRVYRDYDGEGLAMDPGTSTEPQSSTQICETPFNTTLTNSMCDTSYMGLAATWMADMLPKYDASVNQTYYRTGAQIVGGGEKGVSNQLCGAVPPRVCVQRIRYNYPAMTVSNVLIQGIGTPMGTVITQVCPASTDPLNPAYNVPAGSTPGADGLCPTARYNHQPGTPDQARDRVLANPPTFPNDIWRDAVRDAVDSGGQTVPAGITSSGPASQTGTPTTTTTTGGSPSQTVTETKTPTYTYNYEGDKITYNTSITTIINNITNGTTTTTTTEGGAPSVQDPDDPCTANPTRVGCMDVGEAPQDEIPRASPEVSYSEESVGLPSGCPADAVVAGKSFSYQPICDAATAARPWVLVGAVFSSLMLMLAAVRQI